MPTIIAATTHVDVKPPPPSGTFDGYSSVRLALNSDGDGPDMVLGFIIQIRNSVYIQGNTQHPVSPFYVQT